MKKSTLLFACVLAACSVWAVHGKSLEFGVEDDHASAEDSLENDITQVNQKLPGVCWTCKWILEKVKKSSSNSTAEGIKAKLLSVCDGIGLLKIPCRGFVKKYLGVLIEEISTTDSVRTICVKLRACKPKEILDEAFKLRMNQLEQWNALSARYLY